MALTVNTISATLSSSQTKSIAGGQSTAADPLNVTFGGSTVSGTALDQCDLIFHNNYSLAGATTTIDLTALTDPFGTAVNFARVKGIFFRNNSTVNANVVSVGNAATPWAGLITPGTALLKVAPGTAANPSGWVGGFAPNTTGWVTSGSSKLLMFDPAAATISFDVYIIGCSA